MACSRLAIVIIIFDTLKPREASQVVTDASNTATPVNPGWRLKLGILIFIISIVLPLGGIPLLAGLDLSKTLVASISGGLLVSAEVLGIVAIAVMGKPGYLKIKSHVIGFFKQYGPPQDVGPVRYRIGLVMFVIPILFGWVSIYIADYIPGYADHMLVYAIVGDGLLLASLFVLGGDFWDKIRALFIHSDRVCSSTGAKPEPASTPNSI
jgi:hypothetical protein